MGIKSIIFPCYFADIKDVENSNLDIIVELDNSYKYTLTVATPKNLESLMEKDKLNYLQPGYPFVIVRALTEKNIREAIEAYASYNEAYWLKLYNFAGEIDPSVFDNYSQAEADDLEEIKNLGIG